ncbi:MAG: hypothetical protein PHG43_07590 [Phenylobacterium sp.]|nr:hypothetical protein [Phenylobacterium sp.]
MSATDVLDGPADPLAAVTPGVRPERLAAAVGYRRSPFRTRVFG